MAEEDSLEYTPTWIVAIVCAIIVLMSFVAERGLHYLGKFLKRENQGSLLDSLQKLKEELMLLGFISLLLTVSQQSISKICIPTNLTNSMLPCNKKTDSSSENSTSVHTEYSSFNTTRIRRRLLSASSEEPHCDTGMSPLMSIEAIHQLHIFIFVLAVVYVFSCGVIMVLGGMKVRQWKHWEDSIRREISRSNDQNRVRDIHSRHYREFKQRGRHSVGWVISFFKQFYGSVTKSDYISLRLGFIMSHCPANPQFNFHKYLMRTLEHDFKKVVGISWILWTFVVLFLLVNLKGWHSYFWMSFLPLILLLLVGAKLEHVITCLAEEIGEKSRSDDVPTRDTEDTTIDGAPWVRPSDKHFWFGSPNIVLYLIHFILFQNSFEIAFFFWVLCTYGVNSCILDKSSFFIPRLIVWVIVQVLCSYSTLPLYTIVTQMGSNFKGSIFDENIEDRLHLWADRTRRDGGENRIEMLPMAPETFQIPGSEDTVVASVIPGSA